MEGKIIFPVIFGILVLGITGYSQDAFADHTPPYSGTDSHCDLTLNPLAPGVDYSHCDLNHADFQYATIDSVNFSFANLSAADFRFAPVINTNLSFADLTFANLRASSFRNSDLHGADLGGTFVDGMYICGVDLSGAKFSPETYGLHVPINLSNCVPWEFGSLCGDGTIESTVNGVSTCIPDIGVPVTCGTGTKLNETTYECEPEVTQAELDSCNTDLTTVNDKLNSCNVDLSAAQDSLDNLFSNNQCNPLADTIPNVLVCISDLNDRIAELEALTLITEGCGTGYWKNSKHFDQWPADIPQDGQYDLFFVFSQGFFSSPSDPPYTYLEVLTLKNTIPEEEFAKEFLVAVLNFVHLDVSYELSDVEIIDIFEQAFQNNNPQEILDGASQLKSYNDMFCPLP